MGVVFEWLLFVCGVALFKILRLAVSLFIADGNMAIELAEVAQGIFFKQLLMGCRWNITKGNENRVARVVVGLVEGFELLLGQVGNIAWLAATVVVIGGGRVEMLAHGLPEG